MATEPTQAPLRHPRHVYARLDTIAVCTIVMLWSMEVGRDGVVAVVPIVGR